MAKKDNDALKQIKSLLSELEKNDKVQYEMLLAILQEVYLEYNSGQKRNIEKKLYDIIDGAVSFKIKN
jgi:hypothetical protein